MIEISALEAGTQLTQRGLLADDERALRQAMEEAPGAPPPRRALAMNLLTQGRYTEAWPLYEARMEMPELTDGVPRDFPFPRWQGQDIAGRTLILFPEQGRGDQIQFVRFLPALMALGPRLILLVPPPLVRLFRIIFPIWIFGRHKPCFLLVPGIGADWRWMRGARIPPGIPDASSIAGRPTPAGMRRSTRSSPTPILCLSTSRAISPFAAWFSSRWPFRRAPKRRHGRLYCVGRPDVC